MSGAHRTGKTTLIDELSRALPTFVTVDEPYWQLAEEGHEFAAMPSLEDFELQLVRSLECLEANEADVLFDRCPFDILAYLTTHDQSDAFDADPWLARVRAAMTSLDVIVFVPIEDPDRLAVAASDQRHSRTLVDEALRHMVLEDGLDVGVPAIEVSGSPSQRARQVLLHLPHL